MPSAKPNYSLARKARIARGSGPPPKPLTIAVNDELTRAGLRTRDPSVAADIEKIFALFEPTGGVRYSTAVSEVIARVTLCNLSCPTKLAKRLESIRGRMLAVAQERIPELAGIRLRVDISVSRRHVAVDIAMGGVDSNTEVLASKVGQLLAPKLAKFARCPAAVRIKSRSVPLDVSRAQCRVRLEDLCPQRGVSVATNVSQLNGMLVYNQVLAKRMNDALVTGLCASSQIGKMGREHLKTLISAYTERFGPLFQWDIGKNDMLIGRLALPLALWNLLPETTRKSRGATMAAALAVSLSAHISASKFLISPAPGGHTEFREDHELVEAGL